MLDQTGAPIFTRFVPPGLARAAARRAGASAATRWKFKDLNGTLAAGITKVTVSQRGPGQLKFKVIGRSGAFLMPPSSPSVTLLVIAGDAASAAAGQCAERVFNPDGGPAPTCQFLVGRRPGEVQVRGLKDEGHAPSPSTFSRPAKFRACSGCSRGP